jgi:putative flippase GtrA
MAETQLNNRKRFFRFAVVGVSGTIVDYSIFFLLSRLFGFPKNISLTFSFIVAVINNFSLNRIWTYPESKEKNFLDQIIKFTLVSIVGLLIRNNIFPLIDNPLITISSLYIGPQFFIKPDLIGDILALGIITIIVLFWNYFINRIWTYKDIK